MLTTNRIDAAREPLARHGQEHVLHFAAQLQPEQLDALMQQVRAIDLHSLSGLVEGHVKSRPAIALPARLEPAPFYALQWTHSAEAGEMRRAGEELIRAGKVAAFTVAGGQGTRLGWRGPKGTYPATVVTGKPLFRVFAEQIVAAQKKYNCEIPWYIMTSPVNDAETRAFITDNNCFGLRRRNIFMFPQGVLPSFDMQSGRMLLSAKHEIAMNPDGHGGSIKALADSRAIDDMAGRGIEHISYFQVDNPLVKIIDPLFIGLHATARDSSGEMSSKMVAKAYPEEKVGVFCSADGKTTVIEYSDLPAELAQQRDAAGTLRFIAGSVAIHLISVAFVRALTADRHHFALPYHRAEKKVPYIDLESGRLVEPDKPNAVKLETFVFDALPLAQRSIVLETSREEEFAPIKNADGVDSPRTSHQLQSDRAGRWLEARGVNVPRDAQGHVDAQIEISPLTALEPGDLKAADLPREIARGADVVI
jgi:UDP-N-acetylglucosamine/UDP-N-acetylgalactosamine diphosphorylase